MTDAKPVAPYGYCPVCGQPGISRERRPNGDDRCASGHAYPSRLSVGDPNREPDAKPDVGALVARLNKSCRYAGTNNEHGSPISACPGACKEHALMTDAATALLTLQAMLEKAWKLNEDMGVVVAKQRAERIALQAEVAELRKELATRLNAGSAKELFDLRAERDRLTQENARLAGEVAALNSVVERVERGLRASGATLPAPEVTGTIEGAMNHGLCIALCLLTVEMEKINGGAAGGGSHFQTHSRECPGHER